MLSLPLALGTTLATIPAEAPYLHADPAEATAWGTRLIALGKPGARIGLVWAGNPRKHLPVSSATDRRRSMPPDRLAPLFDLPGFHFVSLQKDGPAAPARFPLTDFMPEMTDLADTAALIANLDLVIAVDTAVAHLAAALGKPVWLLNRFDSCWRWFVGRSDSPWYPTLRIFRQPRSGDWDAVIDSVCAELAGGGGGNRGVHRNLGREAVQGWGEGEYQDPATPQSLYDAAVQHHQAGRLIDAERLYQQVLIAEPRHADSLHLLGVICGQTGRHALATDLIGQAIALKPHEPAYHTNLAIALNEQDRVDEAVASFRAALDLRPDDAEAHNHLGVGLKRQGHLDAAIACYRRAIALAPDDPDAHRNLGIALLARGDLPEGWEEFEWRWQTAPMRKDRRDFPQPQWRGEPAEGRTLLIHAEQGAGDTLQFCRYASLAAARGFRVILEVPQPLLRLLRTLAGPDQLVARGEPLPQFDLHCPMLSLPLALGTTLDAIPAEIPYLRADPAQTAAWGHRVAAIAGPAPRIGLAWAGNPSTMFDRRRSLAPDLLAPLFDVTQARLFSLQKSGPAAPGHLALTDFMADAQDFADTAALIANLDLVISADNAVAHLAGALGKPVWLLDRFDPDWRWLTGRRDSPWYPTLRIYRQPHPGDWDAVIAAVRADLGGFVANLVAERNPPDDAARHFHRGIALRQQQRLDDAIACFRAAIDRYPDFPAALINLGAALHEQGHLDEAADAYRRALTVQPNAPEASNNLGIVLQQLGRLDEAIACFRATLDLQPDDAETHVNLGLAFEAQGHLDEAVACCRKALDLRPDFPEAQYNCGNILQQQERLDDAVACYRNAIALRPDYPEAHNNLGNALKALDRLDEAVACYRKAIELRPDYAEAHFNCGNLHWQQHAVDEAAACFRAALDIRPDFAEALDGLGNALRSQGNLDEAVVCLRRAIELKPDYAQAHNNLGIALQGQGLLDAAIDRFRCAIAQHPDMPMAHNNLGTALQEQDRLEEAAAAYRNAIVHQPNFADPHSNLGLALQKLGQWDAAIASYRRAIEINPDLAEAHNNLSMALLARGDLAEGWEENEWRWQTGHMAKHRRDFAQPQWRGEPAEGQTLLIHAEQGLGDNLQFCRYAPLAAERGLRVIVEAPRPLVRLLRSLSGVTQVVPQGEALPEFDLHCPMVSLALAFGTTRETIPNAIPYLQPDAAQVAAWRTRLAALENQGVRVGLVWAGNPRTHIRSGAAVDRVRSMAPEHLAPLFALPGLHFFSLQKGGAPAPTDFPLTDFMAEMDDFADTAALIANLDLVISVDTSVAHLAGSLGKPVWLMDRFDPDWRWLLEPRTTPWYPTLRIYRQPHPGDWEAVVESIRADLRHYVANATGNRHPRENRHPCESGDPSCMGPRFRGDDRYSRG